jgi:periplasmic protein CpxP/Spy
MKMKYTLLSALICGVIIAASPALHAQDTTTSGSAAASPAGGKGGGHKGGGLTLEALTKALTLTDDQQTKIKPILEDEHQKMQALFQDNSVQQADKRTKMKDIRDAANTAIKAVLTPDQATKFDALLAQMQQQRQNRGNGGGGNGGGSN